MPRCSDRQEDGESRNEADLPNKAAGLFTYVKVDDVDDYYKAVVSNSLSPEGEPQARRRGQRAFVLRDPNGSKLASFDDLFQAGKHLLPRQGLAGRSFVGRRTAGSISVTFGVLVARRLGI
jgi:hypothetical protein